ncbi:hypothetical protein AVL48_01280 [Amycolatopsis regifaucium]|uniref:Uncharacterized protein n=1 Tax=Amycolatopsis regifaucium TaxID=546365 RepID=A0A154MWT5_9PSEU|nr:hypothetical protein AVL48_01280 [Amycolatopsis regifaucium]OKA07797.1 hypothetical protein ATP06_0214505 [Amycolatopsis regifaucium]
MSLYHPIGHRATLSFLEDLAGPYQRHEKALLRALTALEASRAAWLAEVARYKAVRLREKRLGRRVPPDDGPPPGRMGGHWYATVPNLPGRAALHALKLWERDHGPDFADDETRSLVRECIATGGTLTGDPLDVVLARRAGDAGWPLPLIASAAGTSP